MLYAHLYMKKHTSFNDYCHDAMDYDDNFDALRDDKEEKKTISKHSNSTTSSSKEVNLDAIVDLVLQCMGQLYHPPYRPTYSQQVPQGTYRCGKCGGDQKSE